MHPAHGMKVEDAMTYQIEDLSSWSSLTYLSLTVWSRRNLWLTQLSLLLVAFLVAVLVILSVPDPARLKVDKFAKISQFLNVFVGLLLGFFMSASVNRWWSCAEGVM